MKTKVVRHVGYWCVKPSKVFPEKRDHRRCKDYPFRIVHCTGADFKLVCTCKCHGRKKR